ncbi:hypothetical protein PG985_003309 [Apiospora marii]|uniref:uncharacterized protein n=1 Tax=Apiospora marii TaxID=335849 RepID=UPI00312EE300
MRGREVDGKKQRSGNSDDDDDNDSWTTLVSSEVSSCRLGTEGRQDRRKAYEVLDERVRQTEEAEQFNIALEEARARQNRGKEIILPMEVANRLAANLGAQFGDPAFGRHEV